MNRTGTVNQSILLALGSLAVMGGLIAVLAWSPDERRGAPQAGSRGKGRTTPLVVYCAAGIKPPVEAAAREYEKQYGVPIQLQYGGSGTLLSNLRIARSGDLYLAADTSYIELARAQQLVDEALPLARVRAVIAFPRDNPKRIQSLDDLLRDDVSVALANPDAASIGKLVRDALRQTGQWDDLERHAKVFKPTVNEVATDLRVGAVDAGIIWDAVARQFSDLEMLPVPVFDASAHEVTISVLKSCRQPTAALHFARYLGARDRGLLHFAEAGYEPVEGDAWAEVPEITFFSGGINRLAIQDTIERFQEREGVRVNVVYNGCGTLVGMMKLGQRPDAYFACDTPFMTSVADVFLDPLDVSDTRVVLLVPRGNPRDIRSLADLAQEGLKLGVANEEFSALGALTNRLLDEAGLRDAVYKNVSSQTPTADLLVNQMRVGSLDAAVVYEANTTKIGDGLEVVQLEDPTAMAVQPFAIGRDSKHRYLLGRLRDAVTSAESRTRFESVGFGWRGRPEQE